MTDQKLGRREAKKHDTRRAILDSATSLFAQGDFDSTTIAQIAQDAGVSERTFFRYFASKEDLLIEDAVNLFALVEFETSKRPVDEWPPLSLQRAAETVLADRLAAGQGAPAFGRVRTGARHEIAAGMLRAFTQWEDHLTGLVTSRIQELGGDAGDEASRVYARVVAMASVGALRSAIQLLSETRDRGELDYETGARVIAECFSVLRNGLRHPLMAPDDSQPA